MELVERLRRLDSCAVSDALDQLGLVSVLDDVAPLTGPVRISGRVVTVQLGPPSASAPARHLCTAAIEGAGPGDVIVVAHQGRGDCAGWGGNLSRAARERSIAGTIIHGAARDIDESREVGYVVFATSATPRTARGRTQEHDWGVPVELGALSVATGDFVVADSTGVVFIPADRADEVVAAAERIADKEAAMATSIEDGRPVSEVMGASYESMLRKDKA